MKKPWVAAVLSLFCPGLGQLYAGRPARGLLFLLVPLLLTVLMIGLVTAEPSGLVLGLLALLLFAAPVFFLYVVIDAYRLARVAPADGEARWWRHPLVYASILVVGLVYPIVSAAFLRAEVVEAFKIPTMSMAPTIERGDRILVQKWGWGSDDVECGDLVVFLVPDGTNKNYVKRVTGLPGDDVRERDGTPLTVPARHLWVQGDNVDNSQDSRHFGAVPFENLVGLVTYRYWPPSRVGTLPAAPPADLEERMAAALPPVAQAARLAANETAAIATLRNVAAAQAHFQAIGWADGDGDGVGEYGGFLELSGAAPARGGGPLSPPVLSKPFQDVRAHAEVHRSGYAFRIFLPGADEGATADPELAETLWCCYAWPLEYGRTGLRTFFVNQAGDTFACDVEAYSGAGGGPAADAAYHDAGSIAGAVATDAPGHNPDGQAWRQVN